VIRHGERVVADIPLTIGVVGALFAPWAAAIGALAALVSDCTIAVVHNEPNADAPPSITVETSTPAAEPQAS
jgi:hypothetical protein